MNNAKRLGMAGFATTAITYGPARVAYGLFLPYFREEFGLSTTLLGLIASGSFVGFLLALAAVGLFVSKIGPRIPVVVGLLSATLGMLLVALANDAWTLAAGVVLAGTSAGWTWSPYNDTADYMVEQDGRGRVLAAVSTGTTLGILATGLTALLVGEDWRVAWVAFTFAAGVVTVPNILILPGSTRDETLSEGDSARSFAFRDGWSWLMRGGTFPLFAVAILYGIVGAFYWSFAVDLIAQAGDISRETAGPLLYGLIGVAGFAGLLTNDAIVRFGLREVLLTGLATTAVATALLGFAPSSWAAIAISGALFGIGLMVVSALLSVWSSAVFPGHPSTGFSAILFVLGIGFTVGPTLLGTLADFYGLQSMFVVAAIIMLPAGLVRPKTKLASDASHRSR